MTVKVTVSGDEVIVRSPYDAKFVELARGLGGRFDRDTSSWRFNRRYETRVREALVAVYGTDGTPVPAVTIHVRLDRVGSEMSNELRIGGRAVLYKTARDAMPRVGEGAAIIAGALKRSGGSARYPQITCEEGTVLEVLDVPQRVAMQLVERNPSAYRIVVEAAPAGGELTPAEQSLVEAIRQLAPDRLALVLEAVRQPVTA